VQIRLADRFGNTGAMANLDTTQWIMILGIIVPSVLLIIGGIIGKIRSEVICNEINKLLMNGTWYQAGLLVSHLSKSFPKDSVVEQLSKMEKDGKLTWGGGPMKDDSKLKLVKVK
jgi:hypothetical protein